MAVSDPFIRHGRSPVTGGRWLFIGRRSRCYATWRDEPGEVWTVRLFHRLYITWMTREETWDDQ